MAIEPLKNSLPDFAKDIRLNVSALFNNYAQSGLTAEQFYGVALAVAFSLNNQLMVAAIKEEGGSHCHQALEEAAKIAATLMAMNNVYYRFIHLVSDKEFASMPAQLRMNGLQSHGMAKADFELLALAVSAINGCGLCMDSHVKQLMSHGLTKSAIQTSIRMAAVLKAMDQALAIEKIK
ncbi:carboxymuconolactone decarboxylase family protein [Legionella oakridgensis]|uniref:Alkyl hydroperoxide reductase AhpD n=2 Tax=Legionella oakridgensis TaxID=29423 RepID=W0BEC3_9GAMM|nr:carboxymuconolactone decarboxylase family protein [Legionella oakridgensis]AHE66977.1 alkylhydroperoxidase AhpD family core domain protein [Legionella oakridgensis ATCC 33761 = DSM 21215]KTD38367.1 alkyl hydroperoxide reductase [Legionella oakridgensis]STY20079.1 alkyl hydroperoxide reductase [Legionella longbeachae]